MKEYIFDKKSAVEVTLVRVAITVSKNFPTTVKVIFGKNSQEHKHFLEALTLAQGKENAKMRTIKDIKDICEQYQSLRNVTEGIEHPVELSCGLSVDKDIYPRYLMGQCSAQEEQAIFKKLPKIYRVGEGRKMEQDTSIPPFMFGDKGAITLAIGKWKDSYQKYKCYVKINSFLRLNERTDINKTALLYDNIISDTEQEPF